MAEPIFRVTWSSASAPQRARPAAPAPLSAPKSIEVKPIEGPVAAEVAVEPAIDFLALQRVLDVPDEQVLDLATIEKRYPLLRNTL
jgi:hypothetical protein